MAITPTGLTSAGTIQTGQQGFLLNFNLGSNANLTGASATLQVSLVGSATVSSYDCTLIQTGGAWYAQYLTTGSEFPIVSGNSAKYLIQVQTNGTDEKYFPSVFVLNVLPNLVVS